MDIHKMRQEMERNADIKLSNLRSEFVRLNKEVCAHMNDLEDKMMETITIKINEGFLRIHNLVQQTIGEKNGK